MTHSTSKTKKANQSQDKWFMSYDGKVIDGITLRVRPDFNKTSYIGEYRWSGEHGINVRWQIDEHYDSQFFNGYNSEKDVQVAVMESFNYCKQVRHYLR